MMQSTKRRMAATSLLLLGGLGVNCVRPAAASGPKVTQGALLSLDKDGRPAGACPLKHTQVKAEISGPLARVTVTQDFENPFQDKIEAVYTFPLPRLAAVDDMTMLVGDRVVQGRIKRREEARAIYEAARQRGQVASLLDQERPNIFTQHVANILPGAKVKITISYVETMKYEAGTFEFSFPMVVGPRYVPAGVPDAGRITPPVTPPGTRAGHDISLEVALDAGVPIDALSTPTHDTVVERPSAHQANVRLKDKSVLPNKDFVLRYGVLGGRIQDAVMTHRAARGGFFTLILTPPARPAADAITPKEIVFVLDTSGSMMGFPIEKAKEAMRLALDGLNPSDTFNLITFSGDTHILFPEPVPATPANLSQAQAFLASRRGSGGTEMMKAVRAALDPSDSQRHIRVVCFMTDGYVGNDMEIIGEIQRHPNARIFSFGIGGSVNRFLLDKMAEEGRGEVEYVGLNDDGSAAARRFHERVRTPVLTDISLDWGGLPVADVHPKRIPDLFAARPLVIHGRYTGPARGVVRLQGRQAGRSFAREIAVELPASEARHDVLATLWARARVEELMGEDWLGAHRGAPREDIREAVVRLGLDYRLMTQYTSFVAVEETVITEGGQPRRVEVPVEMPEGISYEGIFGEAREQAVGVSMKSMLMPGAASRGVAPMMAPPPPRMAMDRIARRASAEVAAGPESKMHPLMAALAAGRLLPREARFVRDGKAEVQVWLKEASKEALDALKQAGFEILRAPNGAVPAIGRIRVEKLAALARLEVVRYIAPLETAEKH
jgi:Ca-activated chloride channel family protein